jgi:hypothetical protein
VFAPVCKLARCETNYCTARGQVFFNVYIHLHIKIKTCSFVALESQYLLTKGKNCFRVISHVTMETPYNVSEILPDDGVAIYEPLQYTSIYLYTDIHFNIIVHRSCIANDHFPRGFPADILYVFISPAQKTVYTSYNFTFKYCKESNVRQFWYRISFHFILSISDFYTLFALTN